jgi:signal transduction histidine kinase/CheY-like chemotaxis protein
MRMLRRNRRGLCFFLLCFFTSIFNAFAAENSLTLSDTAQNSISLTKYFAVLEDKSTSVTFAEVQSPKFAARFKSGNSAAEALSFGYTRSAYWLKLELRNDSNLSAYRMLEISEPGLTDVQFHQTQKDGPYQAIATGREKPFSWRPYKNRFYVLPLLFAPNTAQTIYVRVQSVGPISVPAKLWESQAFYAHERSDYSSQAWYFGMAMAMAFFNLLLFIALRERIYLLYVSFVTSMALTLFIQTGLDKEYFWNDAPFWSNIATNVGYSLTLATLLMFMRKMLNTRVNIPRLDRVLRIFIGLFLLSPIIFAISLETVIQPTAILYGIAALLILVSGIFCVFKRQRSAYFFVVAFAMLCLAAIVTVLRALGLVPTNLLTVNALQFGSILEMLLLAFALADRFNVLRREKEKAQDEALQAQQLLVNSLKSSERVLEERVERRTVELAKNNQKLEHAMRSLEDVERIARHDLKTPLVSIVAAPNLLRAGREMDAREEVVLSMIERAARRALNMINMSLDLYQMETGNYVFEATSVDLTALVLSVVQDLAGHAESKLVRVQVSGQQPHIWVEAEDALCYSIVANILKNAVEAAPQNSVVKVLLESGTKVILRIQNEGAVPESMRERFFAKYSTSGKEGGTGLGTYSSHLLAKIQGGSLTMATSDENGTTLCLELNCAEAPVLAFGDMGKKEIVVIEKLQTKVKLIERVLLVDDDEFNQMIMSEYIPQPPMIVDTAINGKVALDFVMNYRPDLIIMDLEMPVMNGFDALKCIRNYQANAGQVPSVIVAYSGNDDEQSKVTYLALGFDYCLSKPCSPEDVLDLLKVLPADKTAQLRMPEHK